MTKIEWLYKLAKQLAKDTEGFGESFVGKCGNISLGVLGDARKEINQEVKLVVGWVEIKGAQLFFFDDNQIEEWLKGKKQDKYCLHCWLSFNGNPIDLTLAETIYASDNPNLIPPGLTYIGAKQANEHEIIYHEKMSGDDILEKLGLM